MPKADPSKQINMSRARTPYNSLISKSDITNPDNAWVEIDRGTAVIYQVTNVRGIAIMREVDFEEDNAAYFYHSHLYGDWSCEYMKEQARKADWTAVDMEQLKD